MAVVNNGDSSWFIEDSLKKKWDNLKDGKLFERDDDRHYLVDGRERSGKSLFTIQQAAYIDPTIIEGNCERICFSSEEFLEQVRKTKSNAKETKVIIFDEAFRGLSSRSVLSKTNKKIVQALMEMGQNNLVVFIVLPSFFLLDMYPAMIRSEALFHIIKPKGKKKRSFRLFNYQKKASLYRRGTKEGWGYKVFTPLHGYFFGKYPGGEEFRQKYLKKKALALQTMDKEASKGDEESKFAVERRLALVNWFVEVNRHKKCPQTEFASQLKALDIQLMGDSISLMLKNAKKDGKIVEIQGKMPKIEKRIHNTLMTIEFDASQPSIREENALEIGQQGTGEGIQGTPTTSTPT